MLLGTDGATTEIPDANKFTEVDFLPNINGFGYEAFHLPALELRPPVFMSYAPPKRKGEELAQTITKKARVEVPQEKQSFVSAGEEVSNSIDLFEVHASPHHSQASHSSPSSPISPSSISSPAQEMPVSNLKLFLP